MSEFSPKEEQKPFNVFPAVGYWEIGGKPVSSKEARAGLNPKAVWKATKENVGSNSEPSSPTDT